MRMRAKWVAATLVLALTGCQGTGNSPTFTNPNEVERDKLAETPAGEEVELGNYAFLNRNCDGVAFRMDLLDEPKTGSTRIERSVWAVPDKTTFGNNSCAGEIVASKKLIYVPAKGFTGKDTLTVRVEHRGYVATDNFTVEVF